MSIHILRRNNRRFSAGEYSGIYPPDVLDNLISAWPGNGNTNDVYGSNPGISEGGVTSYGTGLNGLQCFNSGGTGQFITTTNVVNPILLAGYSFSAWFNTTATGGFPIVYMDQIQNSGGTIYDKTFGINASGNIYWAIFNGGPYGLIYTGKTYNDGLWHHAVINTNNSNFSQIYVDGVSVITGQGNGSNYAGYWKIGMNHYATYPIGTITAGDPFYFNGSLQDMRYYGATLTSTQVLALYQNGPRIA